MVSKQALQTELDELRKQYDATVEYSNDLGVQFDELTAKHERVQLDNIAHRARESERMRREHAERQRACQEAEREDRRKRRQELSDGMLRLADATEWAIVSDERGKVLELTVPLSADVEPIVHGVLTKKTERSTWAFVPSTRLPDPLKPTSAALDAAVRRIRLGF